MTSAPDFMLIGAEKAGTTWLYRNLKPHAELWLPPEKELHFFDDKPRDQWRREKVLAQAQARGAPEKQLDWFRQFAAVDTSDLEAYKALFEPHAGQKAGEMTTEYAVLDEHIVAKIARAFPDLRIVFAMRDPISRLWSAYKMHMQQDEDTVPYSPDRYAKYLGRLPPQLRTDYRRTLSIWRKWFGRAAVLPIFFDDIETRPDHVVAQVLEHIGVKDTTPPNPEALERKVFAGDSTPIPKEFAAMAAERYLPMLLMMSREMGGPTDAWFLHAQQAFRDGQSA